MALIEREAAIALIEQKQRELCPSGLFSRNAVYGTDRDRFDAWDEIIDQINALPTIAAAPVVHGHWIKRDGYTECSECEYWYDSAENEDAGDRPNYCPNCGA